MGRKVPFPQSKEEAGVLRRELAVRAYSPRPEPPVLRVGATFKNVLNALRKADSQDIDRSPDFFPAIYHRWKWRFPPWARITLCQPD